MTVGQFCRGQSGRLALLGDRYPYPRLSVAPFSPLRRIVFSQSQSRKVCSRRRFVALSNREVVHTPGVYRDTKKRVGGEFRPMRDWIDQLRFIERVAIVILISVIVILEIADTRQDLVALGKVVFETAASASWR
jgi:hypothetical protein